VAGKYGCGWKMREWKKVEGEGEGKKGGRGKGWRVSEDKGKRGRQK